MLPYLEHKDLFDALNFAFVPWGHHDDYSPPNRTALATRLAVFLCPSDGEGDDDPFGLAPNNYRACAGTQPFNLTFGPGATTGKNDGLFWLQSAARLARIRDGTANTAAFTERCRGFLTDRDRLGDYYATPSLFAACAGADANTTPRYGSAVELSGQRWADGNVLYTRYHHLLPPNGPSCNFGPDDFSGLAMVTATSRHPGGVNLLAADGSARFVAESVDPAVWRALGTIPGREVVGEGSW